MTGADKMSEEEEEDDEDEDCLRMRMRVIELGGVQNPVMDALCVRPVQKHWLANLFHGGNGEI